MWIWTAARKRLAITLLVGCVATSLVVTIVIQSAAVKQNCSSATFNVQSLQLESLCSSSNTYKVRSTLFVWCCVVVPHKIISWGSFVGLLRCVWCGAYFINTNSNNNYYNYQHIQQQHNNKTTRYNIHTRVGIP